MSITPDSKPASPFSVVIVNIDNLSYVIEMRQGSEHTVIAACNKAILQHLKSILGIQETKAQEMVDQGIVPIFKVEMEGKSVELSMEIMDGSELNLSLERNLTDFAELPVSQFKEDIKIFQSIDILEATNRFSEDHIIERDSQWTLFKGSLFGTSVAIKKFSHMDAEMEMETEVEILQRVKHPNLISLLGCCPVERCLIFELMDGGSLQDILAKKDVFPWAQRLQVIKQITLALHFLHKSNVVHRSLKPRNILLDSHFTAKISDLSCALTIQSGEAEDDRMFGTVGYIDPFYLLSMTVTPLSDVYTLGLIILQICTNVVTISEIHDVFDNIKSGVKRRSTEGVNLFLPILVNDDNSLSHSKVIELLELGLACADYDPANRPTTSSMLEHFSVS